MAQTGASSQPEVGPRRVADQLGVEQGTIYNWESNRFQPRVQQLPAIERFLGYRPMAGNANSWAERLVQSRRLLGLSQQQAAQQMGVGKSTLARWEQGEREPAGEFVVRVRQFVMPVEAGSASSPATSNRGWPKRERPGKQKR